MQLAVHQSLGQSLYGTELFLGSSSVRNHIFQPPFFLDVAQRLDLTNEVWVDVKFTLSLKF